MSKDIKEENIKWAGRVKSEEVSWWDGQSPSYWWKSNTGQPNSVTLIIVRAFCLHCALLSLLLMIIICSHPSWCLSKSFLRAATCFATCVLPAWVVVTVKDTGSDTHHLQVNSNKLKISPWPLWKHEHLLCFSTFILFSFPFIFTHLNVYRPLTPKEGKLCYDT